MLRTPSRLRPRATLALLLAGIVAAPAAPAGATMLVYRDGNDIWAASPDGAIKQRVTSDGTAEAYYSFPSVDDNGAIVAIKGSSTNRMIWRLPRGAAQPTVNVMPWKSGGWPNVGPSWARVSPSGGSIAYTYLLNHGPFSGYPNGGLEQRMAIVDPAMPGSPTSPSIDQPGLYNPTWFGSRLVPAKNGAIFYETQPLQFTSWLSDPNNPILSVGEVNRAGTRVLVLRDDGRVVIAGWQGTVGSTSGSVTSQCLLPATGIEWAALSPEGTTVSWSDPTGLWVGTVTAINGGSCPVGGAVRLSTTGLTPAFSTATLTVPQEPGRRDPTDPERRDPTDPTDPGRRDPTDPGDPGDPGRDPTDPGDPGRDPGTDPTNPGTDPGDRGADDGKPGRDSTDPPRTTIRPSAFALSAVRSGRAVALRAGVRVTVTAPTAGALSAGASLRPAGKKARAVALGSVRATVAAGRRTTLTIRPRTALARRIARGGRVTVRVVFTPSGGRAQTRSVTIAVK